MNLLVNERNERADKNIHSDSKVRAGYQKF